MAQAPIRVAVVEDEDTVRDAIVRALAREGFVVAAYADARAADEILAQAPDLAVLDVMLGTGDGFALATELRARRDLPVVFVTARDSVADRVAGSRWAPTTT